MRQSARGCHFEPSQEGSEQRKQNEYTFCFNNRAESPQMPKLQPQQQEKEVPGPRQQSFLLSFEQKSKEDRPLAMKPPKQPSSKQFQSIDVDQQENRRLNQSGVLRSQMSAERKKHLQRALSSSSLQNAKEPRQEISQTATVTGFKPAPSQSSTPRLRLKRPQPHPKVNNSVALPNRTQALNKVRNQSVGHLLNLSGFQDESISNFDDFDNQSTYEILQQLKQEENKNNHTLEKLLSEKQKRRKLSKLYSQQTQKNDSLRDEIDSLQDQQRALIQLLQQKDNKLQQTLNRAGLSHIKTERLHRLQMRSPMQDVFLDDRHVALVRVFAVVRRLQQKWFDRWKIIAQSNQGQAKVIAVQKMQQVVSRSVMRERREFYSLFQRWQMKQEGLRLVYKVARNHNQRIKSQTLLRLFQYSQRIQNSLLEQQQKPILSYDQILQPFQPKDLFARQIKKYTSNQLHLALHKWHKHSYQMKQAELLYDRVLTRVKKDAFKQMLLAQKDLRAQRQVRQLEQTVQNQLGQLKQISEVSKHYISMQTLVNLIKLNHKVVLKRALSKLVEKSTKQDNKLDEYVTFKPDESFKPAPKQNPVQSLVFALQKVVQRHQSSHFHHVVKFHITKHLQDQSAAQFKDFQHQLAQFKDNYKELQQYCSSLETQKDDLIKESDLTKSQLQQSQNNQHEATMSQQQKIQQLESELTVVKLQLNKVQNEKQQLETELSDNTEVKHQLQQLQLMNKQLESDLSLKSQAVEQLQKYLTESQQSQQDYESLKDENIQLITQLEEQTTKIMQLTSNCQLKDQDYKNKITQIETELQKYVMNKQQEHQNETNKLQQLVDQSSKKVTQLEQHLEQTKLQSAEMAQELIKTTQESTSTHQEAKSLRDKLRQKTEESSEVMALLEEKERELNDIKNSQVSLMHQSKADFTRVQDTLKKEIQSLAKERDSLEQQLRQSLSEVAKGQDQVRQLKQSNKLQESRQIKSFKEENENLKKQMFSIDKDYRNLESQLGDEQDLTERLRKEVDLFKKKLQESTSEKMQAFESLENYQQIFQKCEESLKQLHEQNQKLEVERNQAVEEVSTIRQRYKNILGVDNLNSIQE